MARKQRRHHSGLSLGVMPGYETLRDPDARCLRSLHEASSEESGFSFAPPYDWLVYIYGAAMMFLGSRTPKTYTCVRCRIWVAVRPLGCKWTLALSHALETVE